MSEYTTEEEELEKLRDWWKDNRWFVISGLIVGAGILAGINWYRDMVQVRAESASALYMELTESVSEGNRDEALQIAARMRSDFGATPYDAQSSLAVAKLHADNGDTDAAMAALKEAMNRGAPELAHVARLRLARLQLGAGQAEQARQTLSVKDEEEFTPLYQEARGDVLLALGDKDGAIELYKKALHQDIPLGDTQFLEIKLQNLGASVD